MINATTVPGIHPKRVRRIINKIAPHPLSKTAKGGKIKQSMMRITKSIV